MAISLTYIGDPQFTEIAEATRLAHDLLQGLDIIDIIERKPEPFDDSVPRDLSPDEVAGYLQNETFTLSVKDYEHPEGRRDVGGRFDPDHPNRIEINSLALPRREACEFAGVIIHECIHALSRRIRRRTNGKIHFSHIPKDERRGNEDTAPYWIQTQAEEQLCGRALANPLVIDHENDDDDDDNADEKK